MSPESGNEYKGWRDTVLLKSWQRVLFSCTRGAAVGVLLWAYLHPFASQFGCQFWEAQHGSLSATANSLKLSGPLGSEEKHRRIKESREATQMAEV